MYSNNQQVAPTELNKLLLPQLLQTVHPYGAPNKLLRSNLFVVMKII